MFTRAVLARVHQIQAALGALALLNWNGALYSQDANVTNGDTYDYVVVGGGTAGSVVAARLVEANYSVLLIEAGDNPGVESSFPGLVTYTKNSRMDWNFTAERNSLTGRCHKPGSGPSMGKTLGGSGATNYMIYARGNPLDYEKIFKITKDPSWKWKNMLKYFKMSEKLEDEAVLSSAYGKYHSSQGTIGVIKENSSVCDEYLQAFEEAGENVVVDNIGAGILGYSSGLYNIYNGLRTTSAESYLPPLKNNTKLFISRNSLVTKIIFDENKNAVGVSFLKDGNTITVNTNKEVIVTCGSIKSPQLLMLSGIGPKKELERFNITVLSDIPVGKNLQNVIGVSLAFRTNRSADPVEFNAHNFPTPLIVGYSALKKSRKYPDYESLNYIIDDYQFLLKFCGFTIEYNNSICDRLYTLANNSQVLFTNVIGLNPKSRGEILLRSTNPEDQPRIITGYYSNDEDLKAIVNYILDYIKIESTPFGQCNRLEFLEVTTRCNHLEFNSREYWRCYALCMTVTTWRHCGTCSLGSVVDTKLAVLGVNRLRVVDASVFPNSLGGGIFAPQVALAEKAAEMIIEHADT